MRTFFTIHSILCIPLLIPQVAQQVAEEFFEQGDIEKQQLHQEPIDMMNRKQKHRLPDMQVGFIDSICLPLYQVIYWYLLFRFY